MERNLTTGSVFKNIVYFSLPYLLSYFLQTLYGMADLFIIGQFDSIAATTSVSIGSQVMHMLTVMIVGLAMGSTVSIGRAIGGRDQKKAASDIGNTVTLFMLIAFLLTFTLCVFVMPIVKVMSTPGEAVSGTVSYLRICFLGIPFITAYNIISSVFRGMGDSKRPMYFVAVACAANILLDYIFIGLLKLGPAGAALGTTCSQAISVIISLFVIVREKSGIKLTRYDFIPQKTIMSDILRIGIPIMLQDGFIQISFIIITIIANKRGLTDAAAVGIVEKIIGFLFLVPSSMLSAVSALGAQNIGAGKPDRAVSTLRYAVMITVIYGIIIVMIIQLAAEPLVGLFSADAAVCIAGGRYIRGYIFDACFAGVQFSFSGYFCAVSRSELSFLHNFLSIIVVRVPGAFLASVLFPHDLLPMGLASACGSLFSIAACLIAFRLISKRPAVHSI